MTTPKGRSQPTIRKLLASAGAWTLLTLGVAGAIAPTSLGSRSAGFASPTAEIGVCALGSSLSSTSNLNRYSLVIGGSGEGSVLAKVAGRALAYFASTDVNVDWSTGVPYQQALANGWLLKDSGGDLLVNKAYPSNYVGDVGNPDYQHAWAANVLAYLRANPGVDGVFIDDVLYDLVPMTDVEAAKYPTQQSWARAELSFVEYVGSDLRSHGYYVLVNASGYVRGDSSSDNGTNTARWWQELGPYVSGLMNEYWQETSNGTDMLRSTGSSWTQNWDGWQRLVQTAQSMGRDFVGITYGSSADTRAMVYGKASFLLDWNGGGGAFIYMTRDGSDPANSAWTKSIGLPVGAKQQIGVGWRRTYSNGIVVVNASSTTSQTFRLGGTYLTPSGAAVSSVTIGPTTAMILQQGAGALSTTSTG